MFNACCTADDAADYPRHQGLAANEPDYTTDGTESRGRDGAAAEQAEQLALAVVRQQVEALGGSALRKRLVAAGISAEAIEAADDSDDPKAAQVELLMELEAEMVHLAAVAAAAEPEPEPAGGADLEAMRIELQGLKLSALRKQATALGADEVDMDTVDDSDDQKSALIELVIAKQPPSAADARGAKTRALRIELQGLKLSELRKRATAAGADEDDMDAVDDSDDQKSALIELVIAKQPPSAANACSAKTEALRIELQGLKLSALRKRATAAGADEDDMDAVDDSDDPKTKLVELVIAKAAAGGNTETSNSQTTKLRLELQGLKPSALRRRALSSVDAELLDTAGVLLLTPPAPPPHTQRHKHTHTSQPFQ